MSYAQVLEALANPTRRLMFESLRLRPHTVGELATLAHIRQPTASQHLDTLRKARLVTDRREGTRRVYSADSTGLAELREYIESFWDGVLLAYARQESAPSGRSKTPRRSTAGRPKGRSR